MIHFLFSPDLRNVPYAVMSEGDDILFVCGTNANATLPMWLREHLVNAVSAEGGGPGRRRQCTIIDLTAARALRTG